MKTKNEIVRKSKIIIGIILAGMIPILNLNAQQKPGISQTELKDFVTYLASDEMRGRANGSPEMEVAARWIGEKFREYGVKPLLQDGSYIQSYSYLSRQKTINERNVIGIIEGADPALKDQYVVLSAHFDHVGVRKVNSPDSIFNGADDNAAGTSTLIAIAKILHDSKVRPGRSIIIAAFSGEENGMRGSRYFVANPPVPLKNIYANINFEMIGHSEYLGRNKYYMTGTHLSSLDDLIAEYNRGGDFQLVDTIQVARNLFFASDNVAFSRITVAEGITTGIPSGTFATTTHAAYIHSPADEAGLFDFENMTSLVNYFSGMVVWLSKNRSEIVWTDPKFTRIK